MRLYIINLFGTGRRWITTCPFLAADFYAQLGPEGAGLGSVTEWHGKPITEPVDIILPL